MTIPDTTACHAKGLVYLGGTCAHTNTDAVTELTPKEFVDFLQAAPERPDPTNPGQMLPAKGAAVCQSAEDWNKLKTALEVACRLLGKRCDYDVKNFIRFMEVSSR